jgi:hypothetical protein
LVNQAENPVKQSRSSGIITSNVVMKPCSPGKACRQFLKCGEQSPVEK